MKTAPLLSAFLASLALAAGASAANTISLEFGPAYGGLNPWQAGGGGEFTAYATLGIPAAYASDATLTLNGATGFETFCIAPNIDASQRTTYDYDVTSNLWVPTSGDSFAGATFEPLSAGSAWLYAQFASGALSNYDYADNNKSDSRLNNASDLQKTIWYLQGETYPPSNDVYTNLAVAHFGSLGAAMSAETPYEFGTSVLDLYVPSANGSPETVVQPVLVYGVPPTVPEHSSTLALLVGAAAGLCLVSRRQRLVRS